MRIELTIKDVAAVPDTCAMLRRFDIGSVNVTDTAKDIDPVAIGRALCEQDPSLDVMVHIATKHHDGVSFMRAVERALDGGIRKLLVVSGHPRTEFDALAALDELDASGLGIETYAVYNPFLTDGALQAENDRLARKLASGMVSGICLQMGTDLAAIATGIKRVRSLQFDVALLGSVPVPTDAMLRRLKERPLLGVDLPESFFASTASARRLARATLADLDAHDVDPLFFFAELDDKALSSAFSLLK